jgi:arylsulfatase A-like enzyme
MNTPLRAGKGTIYEGGIRVCAFANWPGHIPAATIKEPIHAVDWYPTLLKLAGATSEQKLTPDGLDIWPVLTQGAKTPHDAILLMGTVPGKAAIRMGDWKLLRNPSEVDAEEAGDKSTSTSGVELYNLADDISESKNLAISNPEKVRELNARLNTMLKDAVKPGDPSGGKTRKKKAAK